MEKNNDSSVGPMDKIALIVFLVLLALMSYIFGIMIFSYLLSLAAGAMLALICYPALKYLVKRGLSSRLAAFVITFGMVLLAVVPISLFISMAIQQSLTVAETLSNNGSLSLHNIVDYMSDWLITDKIFSNTQGAKNQLQQWMQELGAYMVASTISIAGQVPNLLLQIALMIISFFYFLLDGPAFISWIYKRIPLDLDVRRKIAATFSNTTVSVIVATLAAATVQAFIMGISFVVLSVPLGFLATATTFILAWLPIIGTMPVWLSAALYLYFDGFWIKAILMLIFGLITSLSDNVVRPLILKGHTRMHPLVSLIAIFGGINLFGILGVFIGPVIAAVTISLLQILPVIREKAKPNS
jgi:predicted PurR-regulated permease PerM